MYEVLTSRQIRMAVLNEMQGQLIDPDLKDLLITGDFVDSTSPSETYADISSIPQMREWMGERAAGELSEFTYELKNKKFETSLGYPVDWLRYQKTGLINNAVAGLEGESEEHVLDLMYNLILNGETGLCYDAKAFFATDHPTGKNAAVTMSNIVTADVSDIVAADPKGTAASPSVAVAAAAIRLGTERLRSFTSDNGRPMNERVKQFYIACPISLEGILNAAISGQQAVTTDGQVDALRGSGRSYTVNGSARLASWDDDFVIFTRGARVRPFVAQQVGTPTVTSQAEGSHIEHQFDRHEHGILAVRNAGYWGWQAAVKVKLQA